MATRFKIKCIKIEEMQAYKGSGKQAVPTPQFTYIFAGISGTESEENRRFWEATPNLNLTTTIVGERLFDVGKEYYLDAVRALN